MPFQDFSPHFNCWGIHALLINKLLKFSGSFVVVQLPSHVQLLATREAAGQASLSFTGGFTYLSHIFILNKGHHFDAMFSLVNWLLVTSVHGRLCMGRTFIRDQDEPRDLFFSGSLMQKGKLV